MEPLVRAMRWVAALIAAASITGCGTLRETTVPIPSTFDAARTGDQATTLIVLLPGLRDTPNALIEQGFVRAVRARGIAADVIIADAHFGYYRDRSFDRRLREDIIEPARRQGYQSIWLAGISLGGFGSLLYASYHPQDLAGLIVLAPFLAPEPIADEVLDAGGLSALVAPRDDSGG